MFVPETGEHTYKVYEQGATENYRLWRCLIKVTIYV